MQHQTIIADAGSPLKASEIVAEAAGWDRHTGRSCPVDPHALVQVRCVFERDFDHDQPPRRAGAWDWRGQGDLLDITHYREVVA